MKRKKFEWTGRLILIIFSLILVLSLIFFITKGEWITVAELAKRTKLSRANFYVNKDIRKSLDDARYRQQRMLKINFDSVMEIEDLQQKLRKLNLEMVKLRVENQELQVINRNLQKEI